MVLYSAGASGGTAGTTVYYYSSRAALSWAKTSQLNVALLEYISAKHVVVYTEVVFATSSWRIWLQPFREKRVVWVSCLALFYIYRS